MQIKYFCINLKKRTDRWKNIKTIFENAKINVTRIEAVEWKERPEIWCALSHKKVIEIALKRNYPFVCVFEDDVKIHNPLTFEKQLNATIQELPEDWTILYLWGLIGREWTLKYFSPHLLRVTWLMCTYGILYSKNCYEHMLEILWQSKETIDGYKAIDIWLSKKVQLQSPCFVTNKILVSESPSMSDIQKNVKNTSTYSMRFFLYKNYLRWFCIFIGEMWDWLKISSRSKHKK